jgi:hypothetical protein
MEIHPSARSKSLGPTACRGKENLQLLERPARVNLKEICSASLHLGNYVFTLPNLESRHDNGTH